MHGLPPIGASRKLLPLPMALQNPISGHHVLQQSQHSFCTPSTSQRWQPSDQGAGGGGGATMVTPQSVVHPAHVVGISHPVPPSILRPELYVAPSGGPPRGAISGADTSCRELSQALTAEASPTNHAVPPPFTSWRDKTGPVESRCWYIGAPVHSVGSGR